MEHNTDTLASHPAIITKPSYAQVASLPEAFSSFTIPPPPSEKVLLVRPPEPNAGSSTTRNKIAFFMLSKNVPFRITRIKNINNGGIAICLTTDEDVSKLIAIVIASFSISKPIRPAFGKLTSPTNLHQILTVDLASLFHSKISLLLDSHFPSGASPIPLVLNDCSSPSCLSPSEVEVVFRKLRGGGRFLRWITKNNILRRSQFGFRENRSSIEAVDKLVHPIKNTRVHKHTASTFIDIKSAFDNVDWLTLFPIFHSYRTPLHFQKFLHSYLTNRVIIWIVNTFTIKKQIVKGFPQGSVLSPTLWNIYFNPI
ncbi:uncharacterized protein TNCV_4472291 [Trichonephila clavipes]|uniref:Reverse transcriptase domain-containing protein n=1 Tax=Trichonephila clavipes TaxID=2585209 RepID=A0A8X6VKN1_TRICX|nr:uncharacterized protein TNCV_4472291 [Trichonephila clavipes]